MKNFLVSICLVLFLGFNAYAQDYKTHRVKAGETIEDIAKIYLVTPYDIYALNPDAQTSLQPNAILIIPKARILENLVNTEVRELVNYITHKVKRQETLYSIAKEYNVTIDEIKKYNDRLYSENLRKGDILNIPEYKTFVVASNIGNTIRKYKVLPKEGIWRVAYKFGITVAELKSLNPNMGATLMEGEEINVPNIADNEEKEIEENYGYYKVQPKEGFYRLKQKLGLSQQELETLNPELVGVGLVDGMVLKVPLDVENNMVEVNIVNASLADKISNYNTKRIAVMLPFRLNRIDLDSVQEVKAMLRQEGLLSVSLDFHTGVLTALDSAKQLGISLKLDVYDTEGQVSEVSRILRSNDFKKYDAVIGPFTAENFERAAAILKEDHIPIVSPVSKPNELYSNVFQTIPSDELLYKRMVKFVKTDSLPSHMIIIADSQNRSKSNALKAEFPKAKQIFSRNDEDGKEGFYILIDDVKEQFKEGRTIVFLETSNAGFVSNVTSMINTFNGTFKGPKEGQEIVREVILMTTNRNKAFEGLNISNYNLSNLHFHYPSVNKAFDVDQPDSFVRSYKQKYGTEPNRYATRGFDLTMDIILRLASAEDLYKGSGSDVETEYVENKFRYAKKLFGGYFNEAVYIVKYDDLKIVEVKQ